MSLHPAYPPHGSAHTALAVVTSSFEATAQAHSLRLVTSQGIQSAWLRNEVIPFKVAPGQVWNFVGEIVNLGEYGEQFEIRDGVPSLPAGPLLIPFLAYHVPGLSMARAHSIWEALEDGLVDSMEKGKIPSLARALGGPAAMQIATLTVQTWAEQVTYTQLAQELYQYGFTEGILRKVIGHYGQQSLEYVRKDPYRLLAFAELEPVDRAALERFGICMGDERRLMGIVDAAVYALHDTGTTIFTQTRLETIVQQLASLPRQRVTEAVNLALLRGRLVAATEHHLMGDGFARIECALIHFFLAECNRSPSKPIVPASYSNIDEARNVDLVVSDAEATRVSIILTREETAACAFVKYLADTWNSADERCYVLAGSDALCQRIHAATGIHPVTLQRVVEDGLVGSENMQLHRTIAIVSSTIDFATMAQLIPQLRPTDRLFFVGQPLRHAGERALLLPVLLRIDQIFRRVLLPTATDYAAVASARQCMYVAGATRRVYNPKQSESHGLFWICVADDAFERAIIGVSHQLRRHGSVAIVVLDGDERQRYARLINRAMAEAGNTIGLGAVSVVTADGMEPGDSDSSVIVLRQPEALSNSWLQSALGTSASRAVVVSTAGIEFELSTIPEDNSLASGFVARWCKVIAEQEQQGLNA